MKTKTINILTFRTNEYVTFDLTTVLDTHGHDVDEVAELQAVEKELHFVHLGNAVEVV